MLDKSGNKITKPEITKNPPTHNLVANFSDISLTTSGPKDTTANFVPAVRKIKPPKRRTIPTNVLSLNLDFVIPSSNIYM